MTPAEIDAEYKTAIEQAKAKALATWLAYQTAKTMQVNLETAYKDFRRSPDGKSLRAKP